MDTVVHGKNDILKEMQMAKVFVANHDYMAKWAKGHPLQNRL
jgi:hypothetical protein